MSDKYFKTYAVAQAFVTEPGWEPKSAKAILEQGDAPSEVLELVKHNEEFDPEKDLLKVESVLVSTGMNKNDDVFLADELIKVRKSGAHKLFNLEHDAKKIVGHMIRSFITDKSGREITDEMVENNKVPEDFDITNEAVLYAFALPEVAKEIRRRAAAGQLFVSVEMWFTDYDYCIGSQIFKRNQATSNVLDEHLRANGGSGFYKNERIGRVLRNSLIGGIGFVEKPANKESVIKSISSLGLEGVRDVSIYSEPVLANNKIEEIGRKSNKDNMKEKESVTMSEIKDFLDEMVANAKATAEAAAKQAVEDSKKVEDQPVKASEEVVEDAKSQDKENPQVTKLVAAVTELNETVKTQAAEIAAMKQERRVNDRRQALAGIGLENDALQRALEIGADMDESTFKNFCATFTDLFNQKNLRSQANEDEDNQNDKGGDSSEDVDAESVTAGEDCVCEDVDDADDDDTLIDLGKASETDVDVGAGESRPGPTLEDRMANCVASVMIGRRNKHWVRAFNRAQAIKQAKGS